MSTTGKNIIYTAADLQRYHSGNMNEAQMHALEKAALDDPFLSDALDGYPVTNTAEADLAELKKRLSEKKDQHKIIPFFKKNRSWLRAAAVLFFIAGTVYLALKMNSNEKGFVMAKNNEAVADTLKTSIDQPAPGSGTTVITQGNISVRKDQIKSFPDSTEMAVLSPAKNGTDRYKSVKAEDELKVASYDKDGKDDSPVYAEIATEKSSADMALKKQVAAPARRDEIVGVVIDQNGNPIPYVNIKERDGKTSVATDAAGKFSIVTNDSIMPATIAAVGYETHQMDLKKNTAQTIILSQNNNALEEVVVTGMSRNSKKSKNTGNAAVAKVKTKDIGVDKNAPAADPVGGFEKFEKYVSDSTRKIQYPNGQQVTGDVILSFKVKKNGTLHKVNVEKKLCDVCDKEAIRLLLAGPKWTYINDKRVNVTIHL